MPAAPLADAPRADAQRVGTDDAGLDSVEEAAAAGANGTAVKAGQSAAGFPEVSAAGVPPPGEATGINADAEGARAGVNAQRESSSAAACAGSIGISSSGGSASRTERLLVDAATLLRNKRAAADCMPAAEWLSAMCADRVNRAMRDAAIGASAQKKRVLQTLDAGDAAPSACRAMGCSSAYERVA